MGRWGITRRYFSLSSQCGRRFRRLPRARKRRAGSGLSGHIEVMPAQAARPTPHPARVEADLVVVVLPENGAQFFQFSNPRRIEQLIGHVITNTGWQVRLVLPVEGNNVGEVNCNWLLSPIDKLKRQPAVSVLDDRPLSVRSRKADRELAVGDGHRGPLEVSTYWNSHPITSQHLRHDAERQHNRCPGSIRTNWA